MKFELIAFDIDGTLTESKQPIDSEMAELMSKLLTKYKVAIISGAAYQQFEWQVLSSPSLKDSNLNNLYLLPTDGTVMCTYTDGWHCEADEPLRDEEKSQIRNSFHEALEKTGLKNAGETYGELIEDRGSQMNFSALGQDAPPELKAQWDPDNSKRARIVEVLKELMPDFSFRIGGTTSIEATRQGIDKAYGLEKLLVSLGMSAEKMLYIGDKLFDGGNDAPALSVAGECRAVKGPEETKQVISGLLE